jgi:uncharacterized protein Yka (UPF0111/DUF47 family)
VNQILVAVLGGVASGALSAFLSAFVLTLKYTERLAKIEQRADDQEKRVDRLEKQILDTLSRIENKVDGKVDRP